MAGASNILQTIAEHNRRLVAAAKERVGAEELAERARALPPRAGRPFEEALAGEGLSFICEVKRASPSKGLIAEDFPYLEIARSYEEAGADAISCLTEPRWFQGSLAYLEEMASCVRVPLLRKDFVIDDYQLFEARLAGASAVLLLCALLDDAQLAHMLELCDELGLSALVEAYGTEEAARAVASGARVIGVNNRDLRSFAVDFDHARRLREMIPPDRIYVAESGVSSIDDVRTVARMGADAVLVGEFLMRCGHRGELLRDMRLAASEAIGD